MQLLQSFLLTLGLALVQTSHAVPTPGVVLDKRTVDNLPPSDQFVACPGYRYSRAQVEKAIQQGINTTLTNEPQPGGYPHKFGNNKKLKSSSKCDGKTLWEFPLLHGDRPLAAATLNGAYCGVMTHDGAPRGEFALCPVED